MNKRFAASAPAAFATAAALIIGLPAPAHAEVRTAGGRHHGHHGERARGIDQGELPDISAPHAMILGRERNGLF